METSQNFIVVYSAVAGAAAVFGQNDLLVFEYGEARQAALLRYGYVPTNYQDEYLHGQVAGFALTLPILVERLPAHANGSLLTALTTVAPFTLKVK